MRSNIFRSVKASGNGRLHPKLSLYFTFSNNYYGFTKWSVLSNHTALFQEAKKILEEISYYKHYVHRLGKECESCSLDANNET